MSLVYLGLGSNLNQPIVQLATARQSIDQLDSVQVLMCSSLYQSTPLEGSDGPDYYNQVVKISTSLAPEALLSDLQAIEKRQGRVRGPLRWASRPIDIDILLYDAIVLNTPRLTVPHYDMHRRWFVLKPLHELAPGLHLPSGESVAQLLQQVNSL